MRTASLIGLLLVITTSISCTRQEEANPEPALIDSLLNAWHQAAATPDSNAYFGLMDSSAVFIGTDPEERWTPEEFRGYVMPFFREGRGWDFKAVERNMRPLAPGMLVFDEKLDTWMGPCLSTGIMQLRDGQWKIMHYHLAFTVPNEDIKEVLEMLASE